MTDISLTQRANYVSLVMVISRMLDFDVDEGQITEAITAVILLAAIATSFYGRYRAGGLTLFGARK